MASSGALPPMRPSVQASTTPAFRPSRADRPASATVRRSSDASTPVKKPARPSSAPVKREAVQPAWMKRIGLNQPPHADARGGSRPGSASSTASARPSSAASTRSAYSQRPASAGASWPGSDASSRATRPGSASSRGATSEAASLQAQLVEKLGISTSGSELVLRKRPAARPRRITSAQTHARKSARAAGMEAVPSDLLQVVESAHRDLSVLIEAQHGRRLGVGELELHVEPRPSSSKGGVRLRIETGRGCLIAEDRRDWTFEAEDAATVFYTQLDSAVDDAVYETEAWLDSLPSSSAELRQGLLKLGAKPRDNQSDGPTGEIARGLLDVDEDAAPAPAPTTMGLADDVTFTASLHGLCRCYRSILVECFRHGHVLGRIISKAWAGSLTLLESSIQRGRAAEEALASTGEDLVSERSDALALEEARAEVERLTAVVSEQQAVIDAADSVRLELATSCKKREDLLKMEVAQLGERTMVAESKLIRRDLDVVEREENRKRGATVRNISKQVEAVDEFLDEVEEAHKEQAELCFNIEKVMQATMEFQPPKAETAHVGCQADPEPEPEPEPKKKGKKGKKGKGKGKAKGSGKKSKGKGGKGKENAPPKPAPVAVVIPPPARRKSSAEEEAALAVLGAPSLYEPAPQPHGQMRMDVDALPSPMRTEADQLMANREQADMADKEAQMGLRLASPAQPGQLPATPGMSVSPDGKLAAW